MISNVVRRRYYVNKEEGHWYGRMTLGRIVPAIKNLRKKILTRNELKSGHTYQIVWSYPHPYGDTAGWSMENKATTNPTLPPNAATNGDIQLVAISGYDLYVTAKESHGTPTVLTYDIYDLGVL